MKNKLYYINIIIIAICIGIIGSILNYNVNKKKLTNKQLLKISKKYDYILESSCSIAEKAFFISANSHNSILYNELRTPYNKINKIKYNIAPKYKKIISAMSKELNIHEPEINIKISIKTNNYKMPVHYLNDPYEKSGVLICEAKFKNKHLIKRRNFKIYSILPPVLSNFSLYCNYIEEKINVISNNSKGDITGNIKPLIITNTPCKTKNNAEWQTFSRGFIFIGNRKLVCNIAKGKNKYGETHQIPFFQKIYDKNNENIIATSYGFYDKANKDPSFKEFFKIDFLLDLNSSWIHFYGNLLNPSPSIIIGNVFRRYFQPRALFKKKKNNKLSKPIDLLWLNKSSIPGLNAEITSSYSKYMSQIITEPYNSGLNTMLKLKNYAKIINPKQFNIFNHYNNKIFSGDLKEVFDVNLLVSKRTIVCNSELEFIERFCVKTSNGYSLSLDNNIVFVKGRLNIPNIEIVNSDGVIICDSLVEIKGIKNNHYKLLTIVSTRFDIITSNPVKANLIALKGKVFPAEKTEFNVNGFVAVKDLMIFDQGGFIKYNEQCNSLYEDDPYRVIPAQEFYYYE